MISPVVSERMEEIAALCREHGVLRLYLFGSAARGEDGPGSDVDFLVEFDQGLPTPVFFRYFELHRDLEHLVGRHVDLAEIGAIRNPYIRAEAEASKVAVYAAARSELSTRYPGLRARDFRSCGADHV